MGILHKIIKILNLYLKVCYNFKLVTTLLKSNATPMNEKKINLTKQNLRNSEGLTNGKFSN